jgi:hypothetical protein
MDRPLKATLTLARRLLAYSDKALSVGALTVPATGLLAIPGQRGSGVRVFVRGPIEVAAGAAVQHAGKAYEVLGSTDLGLGVVEVRMQRSDG